MSVVDDWNPHARPEPPCTVCTKGSAHLAFTLQRNSGFHHGGLILPCATSEAPTTLVVPSEALTVDSRGSGGSSLAGSRAGIRCIELASEWSFGRALPSSTQTQPHGRSVTSWTSRNLMDGPSWGYQVPMGLRIGIVS